MFLCELIVPDESITFLSIEQLPVGWDDPEDTQPGLAEFVDNQFRHYKTLCLALPSAVVPQLPLRNIFLDLLHPQRKSCTIASFRPYLIDPQLPTATVQ